MFPLQTLGTALRGAATLIRDPEQTDAVFDVVRLVERSGAVARRARRTSPDLDRLISERYLPDSPDLVALSQLPVGTLGWAYADHMISHGFAVEFYPKVEVKDDGSYLLMRLRQTHDIWHTVTGLGTDPSSELGLQAFMLAQLGTTPSLALIALGYISTLFHPEQRRELTAAVRRGYRLGKATRPLLAQRWEDAWDRPLSSWRREVGLS
jgi:ubiquinone biosynthesis protein Coq4